MHKKMLLRTASIKYYSTHKFILPPYDLSALIAGRAICFCGRLAFMELPAGQKRMQLVTNIDPKA